MEHTPRVSTRRPRGVVHHPPRRVYQDGRRRAWGDETSPSASASGTVGHVPCTGVQHRRQSPDDDSGTASDGASDGQALGRDYADQSSSSSPRRLITHIITLRDNRAGIEARPPARPGSEPDPLPSSARSP